MSQGRGFESRRRHLYFLAIYSRKINMTVRGQECACAIVGNVLLRMRETSIFGRERIQLPRRACACIHIRMSRTSKKSTFREYSVDTRPLTHRAIAEEGGWCPTLQLEADFRDQSLIMKTEEEHLKSWKVDSFVCWCIMPTHYLIDMEIWDCEY